MIRYVYFVKERANEQTKPDYNYRESIKRMLDIEQVRLIVNLDHLRDYDRSFADG
jgi:DNA replication licensing factor MCM3